MVEYKQYEDEMVNLVSLMKPGMRRSDIIDAVRYSMNKRYKEEKCVVDNNYTKQKLESNLLEMTNWINEKQPICTAYGVMFKKKSSKPHPLIELIKSFMDGRDIEKKKMLKFLELHDYENVAKTNLNQLLLKRDGNSIYGCLGNAASVLYNLYVAAAITSQGRSVISTATMFFEGFLANNVKFGSLEEILHYIHNVISERPTRKFQDNMMLDFNITRDMCFAKIMLTCGDWRKGRIKWVPDYRDAQIIYNIIKNLDQEDINRLYYKNNLYAFMENRSIITAIKILLKNLKEPYLTPNNVPEEISVELDVLQDIFREYVYYPHMYIDRIERCDNMIKDVCVISDTDSTIVSFDAFYHFILDKIMGEDILISRMEVDLEKDKLYEVPKRLSYDFYSDELIEKEAKIKPFVIIPQDNLRFSIINIIAYISGNLCNEYVELYTKCNHSWKSGERCLLYLKNEFLFKRALLTSNKKNYATIQELKEGVILEQTMEKSLDIKGLPINKSTLNDSVKAQLQKILYEDILRAENIDQVNIISKIAILEKQIEESLRRGEKKYYKPVSIKALDKYDDPMRIQGIKASLIWNRVKDGQLEAIDLEARNTIDVVKVNITPSNIEKIKDSYPETYEKFVQLFMDESIFPVKSTQYGETNKKEITALAIPTNVSTPEWVKEFIDYRTIINDSICNFPFESVGITRLGSNNINYTTIMKI